MSIAKKLIEIFESEDIIHLCNKFSVLLQGKILNYVEKVEREEGKFINADVVYVKLRKNTNLVNIYIGDEVKFIYNPEDGNLYGSKSYSVDQRKNFGNLKDIIEKGFDWTGETIVKKGYKGMVRDDYAGKVV